MARVNCSLPLRGMGIYPVENKGTLVFRVVNTLGCGRNHHVALNRLGIHLD